MRLDNTHYFIFPEYFDKSLTRKEGRRLPLNEAIENPSLTELRLAAEKIGLSYETRKDAAYPRHWWEPNGIILVEKKIGKQQTLKDLSNQVRSYIRPALEKQKKELLKEAKKKRPKRIQRLRGETQERKDFKPRRRK
ncbi:MAG: hypothetical protein EAX86_11490 [Candidatus Heimdallarchaeota archaeon]|nr:hypothetical protein [Candidatus Heimdallarchaeota archaeon]